MSWLVLAAHGNPPHTVATHQFVGNGPGITHYPGGPLHLPFSDFACKNAKPKDKPYRLADGDGLYLFVQKGGSKIWQLRYRLRCSRILDRPAGGFSELVLMADGMRRSTSTLVARSMIPGGPISGQIDRD